MQNQAFSVAPKGSNETDNVKLYPVMWLIYMGDNVGF